MNKNGIEDTEKVKINNFQVPNSREKSAFAQNQDEENDDDFVENPDVESEKNKIVEYSPKGRFIRFNEELGSGAYKIVYKAYDNETGWEVAWNVIKLQRLPDKERKRISDEIALLKQLKHPNIIHFISAWINRQKEEVIFITEAVTGGSLKKYLKKIKTPRLKVIKTWCKEILQGIEYLHNLEPHPIIHRDIKCDNIFINSNKGEIRIGDLGLATFMSHAFADSVLGTPEFMAPEMYEEVYGPSVDIYSFGMCVLEMVTNQTPYRECMNPAQIYRKVSKGIKPEVLNLIANEEVKDFIIECLKPKDERPTATELLKHKFLVTSDPELDNQPVMLYESPLPLPKVEEENSICSVKVKESSKIIQKMSQPSIEVEKISNEKEDQTNKEEQPEIKEEGKTAPNETSSSFQRGKSTSSEKPIQEAGQKNENVTLAQEDGARETLNKSPFQHERKGSQTPRNKVDEEIKQNEIQNLERRRSNTIQPSQKAIYLEEKKIEQTPKDDDKLKKQKEIQKQPQEEERKSGEYKRQTEQGPPQQNNNKEAGKFFFRSKGIINNFLIITLTNETMESSHEHIIEIPKEKVSAEKIKKKLLKKLDISNPYEPLFVHKLNLLFETLVSQGILPNTNQANLSNFHSHAKSVTYETHKSPEKIAQGNLNSVYFQYEQFAQFYANYLNQIPKEYLLMESEEAMSLRHQREMLELENIHLNQKRNLWDRRQNVMSSSANALHLTNLTTFDPDEFYYKLFHINEISGRSELKKKGSRCTDLTISSVDSATMSPTYSSGNHIQSINNWAEMMNQKKEDVVNSNDEHEKITNGANIDLPLSSQPNLQQVYTISPRGNSFTLGGKYAASTFAIHAMKSNTIKAQSDKSAHKEKKPNETQQKEGEHFNRRPSIEKNLESAQNLVQSLLQTTPNASNSIIQSSINTHGQLTQPELYYMELNKEQASEMQKEVKRDKLTVNTNLSSPPEKSSQANQDSLNNTKPPQRPQSQLQSQPPNIRKEAQVSSNVIPTSGIGSSALTDLTPNKNSQNLNQSLTSISTIQNTQSGSQTWGSQPNSATLKNTASLPNQPPGANNRSTNTQSAVGSSNSQKMGLVAQSSAGSLNSKPSQPTSIFHTSRSFKEGGGNSISQGMSEVQSKVTIKPNDLPSHPTNAKLQPKEVFEKIKNHKLSGTLRRQEPAMNIEDVKMLQLCLELLTESDILPNGHFSHYTENLVKTCQETIGTTVDGIVDQVVWEKMINALEKKMEKKKINKDLSKSKEIDELEKGREEIKKKIKDKQNKEASECMNKIQSKLVDLSDLK